MIQRSRWVLIILLLPVFAGQAETYTGKVVRVLDGDTAEVLDAGNTPHRVRLAGIDAPERGQPFGDKSKQELLRLVAGRQVAVDWHKTDRYGRQVGKLILQDGQDANLAMLTAGLAWWYRKYADEQEPADRVSYEAAEGQAKAKRLGLWSDAMPVPPWEFRHSREGGASGAGTPGAGTPADATTAAACPCGSGMLCVGPKGGHFCITDTGQKRYSHAH